MKRVHRQTRKQRARQRNRSVLLLLLATVAAIWAATVFCRRISFRDYEETVDNSVVQAWWSSADSDMEPPLDVQLLTVNEYSRPGIAMEQINGIVIHYTANPGSSAQKNRDYFENLKDEHTTKASSHFIIGLEGEIIQCIPSSEISYASNSRNSDTLSIECCHPDETGAFTDATYRSLVKLTAWLCKRFDVPTNEVIRHYDVTGKVCPKYFVEHEDAWAQFKEDIKES